MSRHVLLMYMEEPRTAKPLILGCAHTSFRLPGSPCPCFRLGCKKAYRLGLSPADQGVKFFKQSHIGGVIGIVGGVI